MSDETLTKTTESGPVKATVTLSPKAPKLGDSLVLTLTVEAQPQVTVEMPPFGDALGRFSITSFTPKEEALPGGGTRASQRYVLEAPMSGKQRVPPLRVEFRDLRPGQAADGGSEPRELLTEELPIEITSVLPEGEATSALRGLRGPLEEEMSPASRSALIGGAALVAGVGLWLGLRAYSKRRQQVARVNAYEAAHSRLRALAARGFPSQSDADAWYVELSGIVRHYLEDRYSVRAPELTTEEFLREAQRVLESEHRQLLGLFLATCDRVKFAGHRPAQDESQRALAEAERFLDETQPRRAA